MKEWSDNVKSECLELLFGKKLGHGISREVYVLKTDPTLVIKVENDSGRFQNIMEWQTWADLMGNDVRKYLAPCKWISAGGIAIIMARTTPLEKKRLPKQMPAFLGDFKPENYGLLNGRVVCHDYGTNLAILNTTTKLRKANWRDLDGPAQ